MDTDLTDKVVIVTGATRGIGRAVMAGFLAEGARVVGTGRSEESVALAAAGLADEAGRIHLVVADVHEPDTAALLVQTALDRFGRLDVVINNAGSAAGPAEPGPAASRNAWLALTTERLVAYSGLIEAAVPEMTDGGAIVNIAGLAGSRPLGPSPHAGAVTAGILNLTRFYAHRLAAAGIRVNAVSPGDTNTDRRTARLAAWRDAHRVASPPGSGTGVTETAGPAAGGHGEDAAEAAMRALIPLGRPVEAAEVADAVVFLSSARAASITGIELHVDGGGHLGP